jgi:glycosyltransferase involved in cell wall biosynthesis
MSRTKVAFLIPSLFGGGAERATSMIAAGLDRAFFEPLLVLAQDLPRVYDVPAEIPVVLLGSSSTRRALLPLVRLLRLERPDVLYAALPHLNVAAALACLVVRPRPRLVVSVHNNQERELGGAKNGRVMRRLMPWVYRSADAVIVVSDGIAEELRPVVRDPARLHVIPNPVEITQLEALAAADVTHPWLDGQHEVVTAVGRLTRQKDFPTLLNAFAQVSRLRPMARLLIIGEGEDLADLQRMSQALGVQDAVDFPGFLKNPFAYLSRSSCFVMSSLWEGFGMAIVEAMASGAPVVATDCPYGPSEILERGRWGILVPPGAAADLASAILSVLVDEPLGRRLASAGRERARQFDSSVVIPRVARVLLDVARATTG